MPMGMGVSSAAEAGHVDQALARWAGVLMSASGVCGLYAAQPPATTPAVAGAETWLTDEGAIPGLEAADFRIQPAPLLAEGTFVLRRRGRLVILPGGRRAFVFERQMSEPVFRPMLLVPCAALARMEAVAAAAAGGASRGGREAGAGEGTLSEGVVWLPTVFAVTGEVFVYRGVNYLLVSEAPPVPGEATSGSTGDRAGVPAAQPGTNPDDPAVAELIRALEAQRGRPTTVETGMPPMDPAGREAEESRRQPSTGDRLALPEGAMLINRRARLVRSGNEWMLAFDTGLRADVFLDPPMALAPSLARERLEGWASVRGQNLRVDVTGRVLAYEGRNFLILLSYRLAPPDEFDPRP